MSAESNIRGPTESRPSESRSPWSLVGRRPAEPG